MRISSSSINNTKIQSNYYMQQYSLVGEVDERLYNGGCYELLVYYWDVFSRQLWSGFQRAV